MKAATVTTVRNLIPPQPPEPMLEHAIRLRAYELYVQRGRAEGRALDDWLAAEPSFYMVTLRRIPTIDFHSDAWLGCFVPALYLRPPRPFNRCDLATRRC